MINFKTVEYCRDKNEIIILDQTRLPEKEIYLKLRAVEDVFRAIKTLQVRGAPLIGVVAAYGVVLASYGNKIDEVIKAAEYLKSARPTAVNLAWAIERMKKRIEEIGKDEVLYEKLLTEAQRIENEDKKSCRRIGEIGSRLIKDGFRIMVHCNAGALATSGIGTALGILYTANEMGKKFKVYSCETRPLLQGARLTTWELTKNGIETYVICDNMVATYMPEMDIVLVGADRIARNGDVANKIGTKGIAIIAHHYQVPFYVAAPTSTFDLKLKSGIQIPIEFRSDEEIRVFNDKRVVAERAFVCNPAFDVTPHQFVKGIITEEGIIKPPYRINIPRVIGS